MFQQRSDDLGLVAEGGKVYGGIEVGNAAEEVLVGSRF